ncbi:hypothetical protein Tco_1478529 [Tanacetum coccineum]
MMDYETTYAIQNHKKSVPTQSRMVGMPILARITAFVSYVSENGVSPFLVLIMVRCAHKTCGTSSIQSLLLSSSRAFILSPKLLFALSTKPLACGCLMEILFPPSIATIRNLTFPGSSGKGSAMLLSLVPPELNPLSPS